MCMCAHTRLSMCIFCAYSYTSLALVSDKSEEQLARLRPCLSLNPPPQLHRAPPAAYKPEVGRRRCADYSGVARSASTPIPSHPNHHPLPYTPLRMCSVLRSAHHHLDTSLTYGQLLGARRPGSHRERELK